MHSVGESRCAVRFLKACKGCRVDAVAIHSYWCSLSGLQNLVENYKKFLGKIHLELICHVILY